MKVDDYRKLHKRSGLPELTERELQTYFVAELRKNGFLAWSTSSKSKAAGSKGVADVITFDLLSKEVKLYELKGPKHRSVKSRNELSD